MTSFKALLIDIDGTLVGSSRRISPRVAEAIDKAKQRLLVSLISSRNYKDVSRFANELRLTTPQVAEGGARIFYSTNGDVLVRHLMLPQDANDVMAMAARMNLPYRAVDGDRIVESMDEVTFWQITRVSIHEVEKAMARWLSKAFADRPTVCSGIATSADTGNWLVDFTHVDADKGTALKELARILSIKPEEVAAVGDNYNDLPMFRVCGLPIAMGNAPDEVKAQARLVVPGVDDDGLAEAIDQVLSFQED